eukprot:2507061-Rhodomonas_salina.1
MLGSVLRWLRMFCPRFPIPVPYSAKSARSTTYDTMPQHTILAPDCAERGRSKTSLCQYWAVPSARVARQEERKRASEGASATL